MGKITGAKVFTVSTADNVTEDRLGPTITEWVAKNPFLAMEEKYVVQSDTFLSILIFFSGTSGGKSPI
jgi:hypothetical protein